MNALAARVLFSDALRTTHYALRTTHYALLTSQ